ncbi:MAG: DUF1385 domain-containing protein [Chloroflexi bacterium]|nr:DUF1385 domain-containing protein [Chloroflexota bacterium]
MAREFHYGGQAVIEGVMIRGRTRAALAVRRPDRAIETKVIQIPSWGTGQVRKIPLVRGVSVFLETLVVGMQALTLSASISSDEGDRPGQQLSPVAIALTIALAIGLGIVLFFLLPLFVSKWAETAGLGAFAANVVEGVVRLAAFIGYIYLIGRLKDVQRVLSYHAAEHMAVSAHEAGASLDVASVRRYPRAHPRCGTAFLLTVMLVSVVVFMFIPREPLPLVVSSRIFLVPLIAAISYEIIRFAGKHPGSKWVRVITSPNLMLQELTTRPPTDDQIEVAISALNCAIDQDRAEAPAGAAEAAVTASND